MPGPWAKAARAQRMADDIEKLLESDGPRAAQAAPAPRAPAPVGLPFSAEGEDYTSPAYATPTPPDAGLKKFLQEKRRWQP